MLYSVLKLLLVLLILVLLHRTLPELWFKKVLKTKLETLLIKLGFVSSGDAKKLYHTGFLNHYPCEAYLVKPDTVFKSYTLRILISFLPKTDHQTFAQQFDGIKKNLFREQGAHYQLIMQENTLILAWRFYKEPISAEQLMHVVNIQTLWLENQGLIACSHMEANEYGDKLAAILYSK